MLIILRDDYTNEIYEILEFCDDVCVDEIQDEIDRLKKMKDDDVFDVPYIVEGLQKRFGLDVREWQPVEV